MIRLSVLSHSSFLSHDEIGNGPAGQRKKTGIDTDRDVTGSDL